MEQNPWKFLNGMIPLKLPELASQWQTTGSKLEILNRSFSMVYGCLQGGG